MSRPQWIFIAHSATSFPTVIALPRGCFFVAIDSMHAPIGHSSNPISCRKRPRGHMSNSTGIGKRPRGHFSGLKSLFAIPKGNFSDSGPLNVLLNFSTEYALIETILLWNFVDCCFLLFLKGSMPCKYQRTKQLN